MDYAKEIVGGGVAAIVAGVIWVLRTVFTNNKEIELLKAKHDEEALARREELRTLREIQQDTHKSVTEQGKTLVAVCTKLEIHLGDSKDT